MDEGFIKRLVATIECGVCGQRYEGEDSTILGHYGDLWFLSVRCPACHSQGLVAAVIKEGRVPELVTDFTEEEYDKFREIDMVNADDVLDIHDFLEGFDGDLSRIICQK
jgi:transcription elongation factor Elf1